MIGQQPAGTRQRRICGVLVGLSMLAHPALAERPGPPAHFSPPRLDWSSEQLAAFASASARIDAELREWTAGFAQTEGARARTRSIAENEAVVRAAIAEAGLTTLEFAEILRAARGAPRLHDRIDRLSPSPPPVRNTLGSGRSG